MPKRGTETEFELAAIERLETLGYTHIHGEEIERDRKEVILKDRLRIHLEKAYPHIPARNLESLVSNLSRPEGVNLLLRNKSFHLAATNGIEVKIEGKEKSDKHMHVYPINWEDPSKNEYLVVNQLSISGKNDRRPDIVIYVNGLPLVVFELKNPYDENPTVEEAYNQIQHYIEDIPQLFEFNCLTVVSDGEETLHGMWSAGSEWFAPWKSIDGDSVSSTGVSSMKVLIEGLFLPERLLNYIRNFIVFDTSEEKLTKKGAKYHQFFAGNKALGNAVKAQKTKDKRVGVIWHTTGSGKSLTMGFLVGLMRKHSKLENPTILIEVDRTDLDGQLHEQFVGLKDLVGNVHRAESVEGLRKILSTHGGEVIFSTVEKFRLRESETKHPLLSNRENLFVIADEAHRSQYGFLKGYARYLNEALPESKRIGFTGTPISMSRGDTRAVFGDYIHTYDIKQAQEDGATVPIFYDARQIKLDLTGIDIDEAIEEMANVIDAEGLDQRKSKWANLAAAAGTKERVDKLARDILAHFRTRTAEFEGKALVVCMNRENCVRVYDALQALPACPEIKVIMTTNPAKDPKEWNTSGHVTTKKQRDDIKARMKKVDDPLKIAIVCDMWLTGTDIPCLHTLYIDKPMKDHSMIQAISRVNRVFKDKPHGLVVDYIGIAQELKEAASRYTKDGSGDLTRDVEGEAVPLFIEYLSRIRGEMPDGKSYEEYDKASRVEREDLMASIYAALLEDETRKEIFLDIENQLSRAFLLVKQQDSCRGFLDEVAFYQAIRGQIKKTDRKAAQPKRFDNAVRDLVDTAISSQGVIDVFKVAGIERPDISILDDAFLQEFKNKKYPNLRLQLLERMMEEEIKRFERKNKTRARSLMALLEETLGKYHNRLIDSAQVIKVLVDIRKKLEEEGERAAKLGLSSEEIAFYDAIVENKGSIYEQPFLCSLIHDIVETIKRSLKVDWTEPHRESVRAEVRAAVKRVLRKNKIQANDMEWFTKSFMEQAENIFKNWPVAA